MQHRLLDDTWAAHAWWSREWTPAVAAPVGAREVRDGAESAPGAPGHGAPEASGSFEEPDFSEEFGAGRGFAGGSGFRHGEFERWV